MEVNYQKQLYLYCKNKGYTENTFIQYRSILNKILVDLPLIDKAPLVEIQEYAASIENSNTRKNTCVIIRWIFDKALHQPIDWRDLPYPKKRKKIQPIYNQQDILRVLKFIQNEKQKAILALLIDCGLRVSEPCSIRLSDCVSKERKITLRNVKGDNDRIIYPSDYVWNLIKLYWNAWDEKPTKYLFEGQAKGNPYTEESIRAFTKTACKKSGVKYLGIHAIRRFTGTWKVENGVPETVVADSLGNTVKTLHKHYLIHSPSYLKSIQSPLNQIQL